MRGQTTPEQVEAMKSLCRELELLEVVEAAYVDDWGYYGNFQIKIEPVKKDRYASSRVAGAARRLLKGTAAHLRECFSPEPIFDEYYCYDRRRKVRKMRGYRSDYWSADIDFQEFDGKSNSFSGA